MGQGSGVVRYCFPSLSFALVPSRFPIAASARAKSRLSSIRFPQSPNPAVGPPLHFVDIGKERRVYLQSRQRLEEERLIPLGAECFRRE